MNSKTLSSFAPGPLDVKTQVPQIKDANELFALHRFVMNKTGATGRKIVYDMKDAEAYMRRIWREGFEEQAKFGRYVRLGDKFVPSLKGAYVMTWGLLPPMSWIRSAQMNARAQKIIAEWKGQGMNSTEGAWDESRVLVKAEATA